MPHPIVCQEEALRQYLQSFRVLFTRPQFEHFETVLIALLTGEGGHTLSDLHRAVSGKKSLSSLSRFFSESPWDHQLLARYNFSRFCREIQAKIEREQLKLLEQRKKQKKRGKCPTPLVTGYLIGDDSTMSKPRGVKMQGLGRHHSTTYRKRVIGHSLVQSHYTILDSSCPLEPLLYRQKETAEKEGVKFTSKIDLMAQQIQDFTPPPGTTTHILLDSWYCAKKIWKAARDRKFAITTGIRRNRWLRISCDVTPDTPKGWKWQRFDDYAASLPKEAYQLVSWPKNGKRKVWVHVVDTRVRKLYRCQVIIVRFSLDNPIEQARFWVTSDLLADAQRCLEYISIRWQIEVFFEDMKELFGIDQYQLMTSLGLLRYWTLCWIAFSFLESLRDQLKHPPGAEPQHVTLGQACHKVQWDHRKLFLQWVYQHAHAGTPVEEVCALLAS